MDKEVLWEEGERSIGEDCGRTQGGVGHRVNASPGGEPGNSSESGDTALVKSASIRIPAQTTLNDPSSYYRMSVHQYTFDLFCNKIRNPCWRKSVTRSGCS